MGIQTSVIRPLLVAVAVVLALPAATGAGGVAELATVARAPRHRRRPRRRPADEVERDGKREVEGEAARDGSVEPDRLGRVRVRADGHSDGQEARVGRRRPHGRRRRAGPGPAAGPRPRRPRREEASAAPAARAGPERGGFGRGGPPPTEAFSSPSSASTALTGKTLWQKVAKEEVPRRGLGNRDGTYAPSSPVTDGKHVYAYFGSRGLHCYDMGQPEVEQGSRPDADEELIRRGQLPRPARRHHRRQLGPRGAGLRRPRPNKNTGEELWRQPRDEDTSWATPLVVEHEGKAQVDVGVEEGPQLRPQASAATARRSAR